MTPEEEKRERKRQKKERLIQIVKEREEAEKQYPEACLGRINAPYISLYPSEPEKIRIRVSSENLAPDPHDPNGKWLNVYIDRDMYQLARFIHALTCRYNIWVTNINAIARDTEPLKPIPSLPAELPTEQPPQPGLAI